MDLVWEKAAKTQFDLMIEKIPVFMRPIAQEAVLKKLSALVDSQGIREITQKEMVDAFFAATPFGFHGPMKVDMESLGIDYTKYGYKG